MGQNLQLFGGKSINKYLYVCSMSKHRTCNGGQCVGVVWIDATGSKRHKSTNKLWEDENNRYELLNTFSRTGLLVLVILKMEIFLTLNLTIFEWSALKFEPFGLGISRETLYNIAIVIINILLSSLARPYEVFIQWMQYISRDTEWEIQFF